VQIVALDPGTASDADLAGAHAAQAAAAAVDRPLDPRPLLADLVDRFRDVRPDRRKIYLAARTRASTVGYAVLQLSLVDNPRMGLVIVEVHPDHRRRGIGTALLCGVLAEMTAAGRTVLFAETDAGGPGDGFATAHGLRVVETDRVSLLRLADVDWPDVEAAAAGSPPGYRLVSTVGRTPDELLESYTRARTAMNDAPHGAADLEAFVFTPEWVRDAETALRKLGELRLVFAVAADGEVAGFTEVLVGRQPQRAHQHDTAVVPAHRGHGLGLWIKSAMLVALRAERPDVTEIETGNSTANQHMLAINQRLGFRPWREVNSWQGDVPELSARLG
jgi:GNAT superfamily N-acetyltransferase